MAAPVLYGYWRSSAAWRVRLALNLKGIKYEYKAVNLQNGDHLKEDYAKLNPLKEVPTFVVDGRVLFQSMAIIEYLEETHAHTRPLLPKDPFKRALVRQIALSIVADIHPIQNLRVQKKHSDNQEAREDWSRHWIAFGFEGLELQLKQSAGRCCVGDDVTLADICLIPQVANARRFKLDLAPYPIIRRIDEELSQLPEFKASHPSAQPDAPAS